MIENSHQVHNLMKKKEVKKNVLSFCRVRSEHSTGLDPEVVLFQAPFSENELYEEISRDSQL